MSCDVVLVFSMHLKTLAQLEHAPNHIPQFRSLSNPCRFRLTLSGKLDVVRSILPILPYLFTTNQRG